MKGKLIILEDNTEIKNFFTRERTVQRRTNRGKKIFQRKIQVSTDNNLIQILRLSDTE